MKRLFCLMMMLTLLCCGALTARGEETALAMKLTHVDAQDMRLGQCFAPEGYAIVPAVNICQANRSVQSPLCLDITAVSPDGNTIMGYESASTFIQIVSSTQGNYTLRTHQDGAFDTSIMAPMQQYMTPQAYCQTFAQGMFQNAELQYLGDMDVSANQPMLQQLAENQHAALTADAELLKALGLTIDGVAYTMGESGFSFESEGQAFYMIVATMIEAVQQTMSMPTILGELKETDIIWTPLYTYVLVAPEDADPDIVNAFHLFMENTTASDQFIHANLKLANELTQIITNGRIEAGAAYSQQILESETQKGETYADERFTDYLFDQNDYTLSDGSHVKISTEYSYVYEGDNGTVYYSNSAFAPSNGGTQLTPNR